MFSKLQFLFHTSDFPRCQVNCLDISPGGSLGVSSDNDGNLNVWLTTDGTVRVRHWRHRVWNLVALHWNCRHARLASTRGSFFNFSMFPTNSANWKVMWLKWRHVNSFRLVWWYWLALQICSSRYGRRKMVPVQSHWKAIGEVKAISIVPYSFTPQIVPYHCIHSFKSARNTRSWTEIKTRGIFSYYRYHWYCNHRQRKEYTVYVFLNRRN